MTNVSVHDLAPPQPHEQALAEFVRRVQNQQLAPGWMLFKKYFSTSPKPEIVPTVWRYQDLRPLLLELCDVIPAEQAERRILTLENPGMPDQARVTRTLAASLQIVGPGETAPAHRHSAQAFRVVLEGDFAYTTVNGERATMRPGDHVITPSWTWHDHYNAGAENIIFLDGLDLHLVNSFDAGFFEPYPEREQPITRDESLIDLQAGRNLLAMDLRHDQRSTPLLNYSYAQTRDTLNALAARADADPWHGYRMKYLNPLTGGWVTPTIATSVRLLPPGFSSRPYRSTEGAVFLVMKGEGQSKIGDETLTWREHDVFVAPPWQFQQHEAQSETVLFCYSDRSAQENLGLFREERAWVVE